MSQNYNVPLADGPLRHILRGNLKNGTTRYGILDHNRSIPRNIAGDRRHSDRGTNVFRAVHVDSRHFRREGRETFCHKRHNLTSQWRTETCCNRFPDRNRNVFANKRRNQSLTRLDRCQSAGRDGSNADRVVDNPDRGLWSTDENRHPVLWSYIARLPAQN